MALAAGTRLGVYEIVGLIGAGGMGEVYKATDTRLNRTVAIKVLNAQLASDSAFRARFEREAISISQLDHPHICQLFDVGEQDGTAFLVMQYLEGETLEARLKRSALPLDEALRYAIQVAGALDKAHCVGVIHRDLKPGNILLTKDGAKLLDFGLAKAMTPVGNAAELSMLPTTPPGLTAQGTILGTLQYMAPEQLEGQDADARTDIFAFGTVLYEMVAGRKAFEGKSRASLIGAILKDTPPAIGTLHGLVPSSLDRIVGTCLAKDPDDRWQNARDLRTNLRWLTLHGDKPITISSSAGRWRERAAWGMVAALALGWSLFATLGFGAREPARDLRVVRATIEAPSSTQFRLTGGNATITAVSPDGRQIAFATSADSSGRPRLWVRALDSNEARPLPGTDGASSAFWSADSRYVAFFVGGRLMKIDVATGAIDSICEIPGTNARGGSWNANNDIIFSVSDDRRLFRVRAEGGAPTPVVSSNRAESDSDTYPQFLPDGRHFVFLRRKGIDLTQQGLYVGSLDSPEVRFILNTRWNGAFSAGYLLYLAANSSALLAQRFDLERLELTGSLHRLVDRIGVSGPGLTDSRAQFSVSATTGILAYHDSIVSEVQMTWVDQTGKPLGVLGPPGLYANPVLSPDGTRLLIDRWDPQRAEAHVWIFDVTRGSGVPLRTGNGSDVGGAWSADGEQIAFVGAFESTVGLYRKNLKTDAIERLADLQQVAFPTAWSPDDRLVLTQVTGELDLVTLDVKDRKTTGVASGPGAQVQGQVSPNGKWLAFASGEAGQQQVYVSSLLRSGPKVPVSTAGGADPKWSADGRQLYFVAAGRLHTATVSDVKDDRIDFALPVPSFPLDSGGNPSFSNPFQTRFAVSNDGQRFLQLIPTENGASHPMTFVVNWTALLTQ
jgi:Tol biopolymer transport system component